MFDAIAAFKDHFDAASWLGKQYGEIGPWEADKLIGSLIAEGIVETNVQGHIAKHSFKNLFRPPKWTIDHCDIERIFERIRRLRAAEIYARWQKECFIHKNQKRFDTSQDHVIFAKEYPVERWSPVGECAIFNAKYCEGEFRAQIVDGHLAFRWLDIKAMWPNGFHDADWNLLQALFWITTRDEYGVHRASDKIVEFGADRFETDRVGESDWQDGLVPAVRWDKFLDLCTFCASEQTREVCSPDAAQAALLAALRSGAIVATGLPDTGERNRIPATAWIDLELVPDCNQARASSGKHWQDLRVLSERNASSVINDGPGVTDLWPSSGTSAAPRDPPSSDWLRATGITWIDERSDCPTDDSIVHEKSSDLKVDTAMRSLNVEWLEHESALETVMKRVRDHTGRICYPDGARRLLKEAVDSGRIGTRDSGRRHQNSLAKLPDYRTVDVLTWLNDIAPAANDLPDASTPQDDRQTRRQELEPIKGKTVGEPTVEALGFVAGQLAEIGQSKFPASNAEIERMILERLAEQGRSLGEAQVKKYAAAMRKGYQQQLDEK